MIPPLGAVVLALALSHAVPGAQVVAVAFLAAALVGMAVARWAR